MTPQLLLLQCLGRVCHCHVWCLSDLVHTISVPKG